MPRRSTSYHPTRQQSQSCFFAAEDYQLYLDWLQEYAHKSGCQVHAYVLMTNHVHLLLTPQQFESAGNLMKLLGQRYVQYINEPVDL